jgi:hypothetical protein
LSSALQRSRPIEFFKSLRPKWPFARPTFCIGSNSINTQRIEAFDSSF